MAGDLAVLRTPGYLYNWHLETMQESQVKQLCSTSAPRARGQEDWEIHVYPFRSVKFGGFPRVLSLIPTTSSGQTYAGWSHQSGGDHYINGRDGKKCVLQAHPKVFPSTDAKSFNKLQLIEVPNNRVGLSITRDLVGKKKLVKHIATAYE